MAMEIVTTTTLALGSKELTKHGAIVTRLAAIEDMAGMAILCSDKTGTLTLNQMHIQEHTPVYSQGENQYSLLRLAAMAAKWKEPARDALDKLVLGCDTNPNGVDLASMDCIEQLDYLPFDPIIKRTQGTVKDKSKKINGGNVFKTCKGAPQVLLKLVEQAGGCDAATKKAIENDGFAHLPGSPSPRYQGDCKVVEGERSRCEDDYGRPLVDCSGDLACPGHGWYHSIRRRPSFVGPRDQSEA